MPVRHGAAKKMLLLPNDLMTIKTPFMACLAGDGVCHSEGLGQNAQVEGDFTVSADLDMFWAHWRYNLEDPGCELLGRTATDSKFVSKFFR